MNSDPFYKVILEALITDTEASLRMLNDLHAGFGETVPVGPAADIAAIKSSLRRAIADAKLAMKGFEND